MNKKLFALLITFMMLFSGIQVFAEQSEIIFEKTITVTEDGGKYQVGFATLEFKKDFIDPELLPVTFEVKLFAKNGEPGIQIEPSTPNFYKKVHIKANQYSGYLYDEAAGKNIFVNIKKQQILAEHFSWYRWR